MGEQKTRERAQRSVARAEANGTGRPSGPTLHLKPGRVAWTLSIVSGLLVTISVVTQTVQRAYRMRSHGLIRMFDLNMEGNVPSIFSTLLLVFAALLLLAIGTAQKSTVPSDRRSADDAVAAVGQDEVNSANRSFARHWQALGWIFVFLAVDEAGSIHELTMAPLRTWFGLSGYFHFAWVLPAALLLVVFVVAYIPFLRHLGRRDGGFFVLSGAIYVGGAVGMEMLGSKYFSSHHGRHDATYMMLTTVEEALELAGLVLFIHILLSHMSRQVPSFVWSIGPQRSREGPAVGKGGRGR